MKIRFHHFALLAIAATLITTACNKEEDEPAVPMKTVTLGTSIADDQATKLYINDDNITPYWEDDDQIYVNGYNYTLSGISGGSALVTVNVPESTTAYYALYPASLAESTATFGTDHRIAVTLPAVQEYETTTITVGGQQQTVQKVALPMGAYTEGTHLTFHNLCSLVKVKVKNTRTDSTLTLHMIKLTASATKLWGDGHATLNGAEADNFVASSTVTDVDAQNTVSLRFPNGETLATGAEKEYYLVVPAFTSNDVTIQVIKKNGYAQEFAKSGATLGHNRIATITAAVSNLKPEGAEDGEYHISEDQKIYFSHGNLQYLAASTSGTALSHAIAGGSTLPGLWRFADNQWDVIGNTTDNVNPSANATTWVDCFGWGTSGNNNKYPWMTTGTNSDYTDGQNNNISGTNYDWGLYNAISNAGDQPGLWRTITSAEMDYLLNSRSTSCTLRSTWTSLKRSASGTITMSDDVTTSTVTVNNCRYARVKVNGVCGLLLFPDQMTANAWPTGVDIPKNINHGYYNSNSRYASERAYLPWNNTDCITAYDVDDFLALENLGFVFLPACGYREVGNSIHDAGEAANAHLCYWTGTTYSATEACRLCVSGVVSSTTVNGYSAYMNVNGPNDRAIARAVRLVQVVPDNY